MSKDDIKLLIKSLGEQIVIDNNAGDILGTLTKETLRFRDKLLEENGLTLTVADTRIALEALEEFFQDKEPSQKLTSEQASLLQIWIDKITLFSK
ncbi:MAG: hypothetical protein IID63_07565 [candidate division Zixibacteria bacterium]|nr:hypothetical protein [candidate division Zixibacteria bacterium]